MNVTEYLFNEYKSLTTSYVEVSKQLRDMLPTFNDMNQTSEAPGIKATKKLLLDLDKTEEQLNEGLQKLRNIKHMLVGLL
jgi:hypothetical protein